jgi:serine/threonine-protein kinase
LGRLVADRYEIVAVIGSGGSAVVYRAMDRRLRRTVAFKILHPHRVEEPDYVSRFEREAHLAARLSDAHIVAVFDQGWLDGRPYIVMELIQGQSLYSIIAGSGPLPVDVALRYAHEIASGLAVAHEAGLIHRDIKPANVMVTTSGQVKLADFGLAKSFQNSKPDAQPSGVVGTISYMAPEMAERGEVTETVDVYSWGIVLFEMLTGRRPYISDVKENITYRHIHEDVPAPSSVLVGASRARVPDYVDALVQAATARRIRQRPANGRALEEDTASAIRALDAGRMHDPDLVRRFQHGPTHNEPTPISSRSAGSQHQHTVAPATMGPANRSSQTLSQRGGGHVPNAGRSASKTGLQQPAASGNKLTAAPIGRPSSRSVGAGGPGRPISGRKKRRRGRAPLIVALVVFLVLASGVGSFTWWMTTGRYTTVPDLVHLNESDAVNTASSSLIELTTLKEYSETEPLGQIIRTDPVAGERIVRQSTVTAYMSLGPERYPMPSVAGLTREAAQAAIVEAHLKTGTVTEVFDEQIEAGIVVSASQQASTPLARNTAIDLTVSKGRQPIDIIDQSGRTFDDANSALTEAGLVVSRNDDYSTTVPAGTVISQDPASGQLYRSDPVTLVVSLGPRMVTVPDFSGKSAKQLKEALQQIGLIATEVYDNQWGGIRFGLVTGVEPPAGTVVAEGSTVTVHVV